MFDDPKELKALGVKALVLVGLREDDSYWVSSYPENREGTEYFYEAVQSLLMKHKIGVPKANPTTKIDTVESGTRNACLPPFHPSTVKVRFVERGLLEVSSEEETHALTVVLALRQFAAKLPTELKPDILLIDNSLTESE